MSNFRKFISMSAVAMLGVTNLLTPLSYASAATGYDALTTGDLEHAALRFVMPDHDVFLKAYTEANTYYVKYHGNEETSGEMGTGEFTYDTTGHLAPNGFVKTGYSFNEWNTSANGSGTSYESGAEVLNWTTEENGVVPIYVQWSANRYNIDYDLNDGTGTSSAVHPMVPTSGVYDQDVTIQHPSRTGYTFSGWDISNMDTEKHTIGSGTSYSTTASGIMATLFENLRASTGTVHFTAKWSKNKNTKYKVEHYLETLVDNVYSGTAEDVDNLTGTTDEPVTPNTNTYTGFTAPVKVTTGVKADGSTYIRYNYDRNSYDLTLVAGRGIASVSGTGTVTTGKSSSTSTTISFKYDEPVTVKFTYKSGYENGTWSGYKDAASGFNMGASSGTKTAYATPIEYTITYNTNGASVEPSNPTKYTVESGDIVLNNPTGSHSDFLGWTGTDEPVANTGVTIASGSLGNRTFTAVWKCHTGYHPNAIMSGDNYGTCNPDEDTEYTVKHTQQDLSGNYTIEKPDVIQTGQTDTQTQARENHYEGFATHNVGTGIIKGDKSTVVEVTYERLSYSGTIEPTTGIVTSGANGAHSPAGGPYKYQDTVTLSATTGAGYTFDHWTVENASGGNVSVSGSTNMNGATFTMPASPVTITPHLTVNEYTITYDLNSGTVAGTNPTKYTVESGNITLINPTRDHSNFDGWSGTDISGLSGKVVIAKGSVGDRSYEAIWSCHTGYHESGDSCVANTYEVVVWDGDGTHGAADPVEFTYDQTGSLPKAPSQSGYDFVGWDVEGMSGGVDHYIGEIIVTGDTYIYSGTSLEFMNLTVEQGGQVKLTAKWSPRDDTKYVVNHYIKNVDSNTYTLSGTVEYTGTTDTPVVFANVDKEFFGFTYSGGYVNAGNETRPTTGKVTSGNIEKDGSLVINLYYDRNKWTVYLSGDEHVATLSGAGTYEYGKEVTVTATAKTGYHFKTWKRKANSGFVQDYTGSTGS